MTIQKLVNLYIQYGKNNGFFHAEMVLMKYLPDNKPDGICADVPVESWGDFAEELKKGI
jgi:hypothetical protein